MILKKMLGDILTDMGFTIAEELMFALQEQDSMSEIYRFLDRRSLITAVETESIVNSTLNLAEVLNRIMTHARLL